jgi:polar amino acid transport system substrate-binding protein
LPAAIKDKGEISAAIVPNYPPMDFKDPATNTLTGFDFDLGNALAERLGVKIKWQETGFEQMLSGLTPSAWTSCCRA